MKFSVLLPTRDRLEYLRYAIESVRRQDYPNWQIVVSDNCSDEDISGYVRSLNEPRIIYIRTASLIPVTANWNNALSASDGDYVVMLGDDDCLMPGYFARMAELLKQFQQPDLIFYNAYQFAYPGVVPGYSRGFVMESPRIGFFKNLAGPRWLTPPEARDLVRQSARIQLPISYNMQHLLVSRELINQMLQHGPFYQSPYPDYYATNALFLLAKKPLILPDFLTLIGISPKSFGNFLLNDDESNGVNFLKNQSDLPADLESVLLPGLAHNTSWLAAMEQLQKNFAPRFDISVSRRRYRLLQIAYVLESQLKRQAQGDKLFEQMWSRLTLTEKSFARLVQIGLAMFRIAPPRRRQVPITLVRLVLRQYPWVHLTREDRGYQNALEMFEDYRRLMSSATGAPSPSS